MNPVIIKKAIIHKTHIPFVNTPALGITLVREDNSCNEVGPYIGFGPALDVATEIAGQENVFTLEEYVGIVRVGDTSP